MRAASNRLYQAIQDGMRNFYPVADITFPDGTKKTLTKGDLTISGNAVYDSAGSSVFPLGICVGKTIELTLLNDEEQWNDYQFYGAEIFLRTCYDFNDQTEFFNIGTFRVINPVTPGITITLQAIDDAYKLDKAYDGSESRYPISAGALLRNICSLCDINLQTGTFLNSDFIVQAPPENVTCRDMVGMIAMLAGGNAKFDEYNRLSIKTYDLSVFKEKGYDGGQFDKLNSSTYQTGDALNGGSFNPWTDGGSVDGGYFGDRNNLHLLSGLISPSITFGDITITGLQMSEKDSEEKTSHLYGKTGYVLQLENALVADDQIDDALNRVGSVIVGLIFRSFESDHVALPMVEFMDLAFIFDRKGRSYQTVITDCDFKYFGTTSLKCQTESPITQNRAFSNADTVKVAQELKGIQQKERTEREKALETLADQLAHSSGLYMTLDVQKDGSTIYYLHDKPTILESMIIWKITAEAIGISTDGGKTYPIGLDAQGTAILNRIYTIGLDADYIRTGALQVKKNGVETCYIDCDTGEVRMQVKSLSITGQGTIQDIVKNNIPADGWSKATQEDVFNRLTKNGALQGVYMENNKLYLNFDYAKGGTLVLGGSSNQYGKLQILNSSGSQIGSWNNTGINVNGGTIAVKDNNGRTVEVSNGEVGLTYSGYDLGAIGPVSMGSLRGISQDMGEGGNFLSWRVKNSSLLAGYEIIMGYCGKTGYSNNLKAQHLNFNVQTFFRAPLFFGYASDSYGGWLRPSVSDISLGGADGLRLQYGDPSTATSIFDYANSLGYARMFKNLNMLSHSITNQSDERLKKNIKELDVNALALLNNLGVFSYDWKESNEHIPAGFIAQDMEKILPELVSEDPDGIKSIKQIELIPYLVKAVQELSAKVEELEKKVSEHA